jgi:hypothetical protein
MDDAVSVCQIQGFGNETAFTLAEYLRKLSWCAYWGCRGRATLSEGKVSLLRVGQTINWFLKMAIFLPSENSLLSPSTWL